MTTSTPSFYTLRPSLLEVPLLHHLEYIPIKMSNLLDMSVYQCTINARPSCGEEGIYEDMDPNEHEHYSTDGKGM